MQLSQDTTARPSRTPLDGAVGPVGVAAVVFAVLLSAIGVYAEKGEADTTGFLVVCAIITVAAVAVFGFVVPRGLRRESAGGAALVLTILGLLTVAAFWSGLPPILAAGGMLLGWAGRNASRGRVSCRIALAIGTVALAADVAVAIGDWLANN